MRQLFSRIIFTLMCIAMFGQVSAVEVEVDGIIYDIIKKTKSANLLRRTYKHNDRDLVIPSSITYEEDNYSVVSIGDKAFHSSALTSVAIPNSVTSIGVSAFESSRSLSSVVIGNSVTSIGESAFKNCESLTSVVMGNSVRSIEKDAFYGDDKLNSVYIDDIANWLNIRFSPPSQYGHSNPLYYAHNLYINGELVTDLVIPDTVVGINSYAFEGCSLTSITIPNSVTDIGESAFWGCSHLASVTIPNSVTRIEKYAFLACWSLVSVTIPNSVTDIGESAFYGCHHLTSVTIPNSVTRIEKNTFWGCSSLASVSIPNSVTDIGDDAFRDCDSLTSVIIPEGVVNIGRSAFSFCDYLASVSIPNTVDSFGSRTFMYCYSLTSINIPNSVIDLGYETFLGCESLASVVIGNSVTSISGSFKNCKSLTSVVIGNSVGSIYGESFSGCSSLTSIDIPNSVTGIGEQAFFRCSSLSSIDIPNSVTGIGEQAFMDCSSLSSIDIPNSVTSIGKQAFYNCSSLSSITIPNSLKSIGEYAFARCVELTDFFSWAEKVPSTTSNVFDNSYVEYATLHVPASAIEVYKSTAPWKNFGSIVALGPSIYKITYYVDGEVYKTDSVAHGAEIVPLEAPVKEGYIFSGWSEIPATMPDHDVVVYGSFIEEGEAPREVLVAKITYTDGPFPFYPMGCEPPVVDGSIHYVTSSSDWSQFFIATEVKLAPGDYKAVVRAKASSYFDARFVIQNGWESYSQQYVSYAPTYTEWKDIEIPFYGAEGGIYDFIYQPEWFQGTVDINSLSIYQITTASDIYKISYFVDNELFKEYSLPYGAVITPEAEPTKEGYTFSGWSEIPATMPDHDVVVNGSFIPSGISYIYNDMDDDREYYTLDGKRVNNVRQGLYIVRKKK